MIAIFTLIWILRRPIIGGYLGPLTMRGNNVYSVRKLWRITKNCTPVTVKITDLENNLNEKNWEVDGIAVTPASILLSRTSHHIADIENADLSYPIIVYNNDVIDGLHRLCKAKLAGATTISAVIIDKKMLMRARIGDRTAWPTA